MDECCAEKGHEIEQLARRSEQRRVFRLVLAINTTMFVAEVMFEEFREARYAPPPLLKRMVMAGRLGRKSGRGFYDYSVK